MKHGFRSIPYIAIFILLFISGGAYLFSAFLKESEQPFSSYPQGYFIKSKIAGKMRIIPLGGQSLKSPLASDPGAIYSPYIVREEKISGSALQNPSAY